ncbi:energy transducer TonB [Pseudoxanthomonas broegbernensis]|uniref:Protein TonB n=1 Tax=Pseudoxanthomonas broegbernensis TaxID=83619 RepID=A0A7V8K7R8_9GAMM|nr:energy transducer TonB [Pseudoxanthomonas broegbernensis]KAF1686839.1 energy transducer TonB [Pseudoxanthomonas broegbernensis]
MQTMTISSKSRLAACLLLALMLGACSKQEEAAPAAAPPADGTPAAAEPAAPPAPAVAASVQAMSADQLREAATQALRENRMYAPAGDNAMEYYLALRDKLPDDPSVNSALTDLMPYTVIATEQAVGREQFGEAQRLAALIEKGDASAPALPRIKQSIVSAQQAVAQRSEAEATRARAEVEARTQAEQQRAVQQQAAEADAARRLAEQQEAARLAAERQEAEQRAAEQRAAQAAATQQPARPAAAPTPPQRSLRAVSMAQPRYPPEALRSGTAGEVLVEFTVERDGSVSDARVLRATPPRTFDREALNAVRRWRFEAGDTPVTTRRTLVFSPAD